MVASFASSSLRSILLVCYSLTPFWFRDPVLKSALQSFHKGNELAQEGNHRQASKHFQEGLFLGRPVVVKLQEQQSRQSDPSSGSDIIDNPYLALEWLTMTYLASARSHIQLGDYEAARRDAWAASLLSHNNQAALACMIDVCQKQNDKIGELSSLKMFLSAVYVQQQEHMESSGYSFLDDGEFEEDNDDDDDASDSFENEWDVAQLQTRIAQLKKELDETYRMQRNDTHVVDA